MAPSMGDGRSSDSSLPVVNTGAGGPTGYNPAVGGVPNLPSSSQLSQSQLGILNNAIPGFSNLTNSATGIIGSALSGQVPQDVQQQIQDASAAQAVMGGQPGTNMTSGTNFGNSYLKNLGLTSLGQNQTGMNDLLSLVQGYSGTVNPTMAQNQEQTNAQAQYAAAPQPAAAFNEQQALYQKYSAPPPTPKPNQYGVENGAIFTPQTGLDLYLRNW